MDLSRTEMASRIPSTRGFDFEKESYVHKPSQAMIFLNGRREQQQQPQPQAMAMFIFACAWVTATAAFVPSFLPASKQQSTALLYTNKKEHGDEPRLPLDYFSQSLQDRIQQMAQTKERSLERNWKDGNCQVRGFSLDAFLQEDLVADGLHQPEQSVAQDKICVSSLCQPATCSPLNDNTVIVGRTDGSVCIVRLGTELFAQFTHQLKMKPVAGKAGDDGNSASFTASYQLERSLESFESGAGIHHDHDSGINDGNGVDQPPSSYDQTLPKPFNMLAQFSTGKRVPVTGMVLVQSECSSIDAESTLFITVPGVDDYATTIQQWRLDDLLDADDGEAASLPTFANTIDLSMVRSQDSVDLKLVTLDNKQQVLVTVSSKGMVSVWDTETAEVVAFGQIPSVVLEDERNSDRPTITCMAVSTKVAADEDSPSSPQLYFGTSTGHVLAYRLQEDIMRSCHDDIAAEPTMLPPPSLTFSATNHQEHIAVTALCHAGKGTLGESRNAASHKHSTAGKGASNSFKSQALVVGLSNGGIYHYEILEKSTNAVSEGTGDTQLLVWPRMSSQTFPNRKVHILQQPTATPIWKLEYLNHAHLMLATTPSSLSILNGCTGASYMQVPGLHFASPSTCGMVVTPTNIISNGQEEMVCIHDFEAVPPLWQEEEGGQASNSYLDSLEQGTTVNDPFMDYTEDGTD